VVSGNSQPAASSEAGDDRSDNDAGKISIEEVNFTPRTTNALINNDVKSIKDLLRLSDQELKDLKGFGAKAYDEVKDKLAELGFAKQEQGV
jgi:DNA-directed RNA polymerase alpha subunit